MNLQYSIYSIAHYFLFCIYSMITVCLPRKLYLFIKKINNLCDCGVDFT